jgi:D-ribulokinase
MTYSLGIDFGTSGARAIVIDPQGLIQAQSSQSFTDPANPKVWQTTLFHLLGEIPRPIRQQISAIALNGTSSTCVMCNAQGQVLLPALMYNDARAIDQVSQLTPIAPPNHTVLSATSSLAKLLWYAQQPEFSQARYFLHQADWLAGLLHGQMGISDYHNSLKLGYDVGALAYPDWLLGLDIAGLLPRVLVPGSPIGPITPTIAEMFDLPRDCLVCAGTTDSIAAFLASGAKVPGEAVTSLGSTLVLKLLSTTRVDDSREGIYSHRLGDLWLVGGASNTGGAVLRSYFSDAQLASLSAQIDPTIPSELDYYPLLQPGERFPINDPGLPPRLTPRPTDDRAFLQGLLEAMARIEAKGYDRLQQLGASPLHCIYTAGGGANNPTWSAIRQRWLGVPGRSSWHTEAAYGTALLAQRPVSQPSH